MPAFTAVAAAIVGFIGLTGTAAAVATFVVKAVITLGVSRLATKMLAPKNSQSSMTDQGIRLQLEPATDNKLPVVYGSAYIGGAITDAYMASTDGKTNNVMWYCVAISEKTGNLLSTSTASQFTFGDIYWGNNKITFKADGVTVDYTTDNTGGIDRNPSGLVQVYLYRDGGSNPVLPEGYSATLPGAAHTVWGGGSVWSAANRMEGTAFALIKVTYNRDKSVTGLQAMQFQIKNTLKDPGDVFYDYITNQRYGAGIDAAEVDTATLAALTTYSQESVTYNGTETLPDRYQINGVIRTQETVLSNLERIASAAGSWVSYDIGTGKWGVVINKAKSGVVDLTFDNEHILGQIQLSGTALDSLYNGVEIRFPHRDLRDQSDYRTIDLAEELRNPNEPDNILTLNIDLCNEPVQAQILADLELHANRLEKVITFNTDYSRIQTEAGDIIAVYSDVYGWNAEGGYADGKDFRVLRVVETEDESGALVVQITAKEYDDVYNPGALTRPPVLPDTGIIADAVLGQPAVPTWKEYNNNTTPTITLSAVVPTGDYAAVTHMEFFASSDVAVTESQRNYFRVGATDVIDAGVSNGVLIATQGSSLAQGSTVILENVSLPLSNYVFKVRCINQSARGPFSDATGILNWRPNPTPGVIGPNPPVRVDCNTVVSFRDYISNTVGGGDIDYGSFTTTGGTAGGGNTNAAVNYVVSLAARQELPKYTSLSVESNYYTRLMFSKNGNTVPSSSDDNWQEDINYLIGYGVDAAYTQNRTIYSIGKVDPNNLPFLDPTVGYVMVDYTPDRDDGCPHGIQIVNTPGSNFKIAVKGNKAVCGDLWIDNINTVDLYNVPQVTVITDFATAQANDSAAVGLNNSNATVWMVAGGTSNDSYDDASWSYHVGNVGITDFANWTGPINAADGGRIGSAAYGANVFVLAGNYDGANGKVNLKYINNSNLNAATDCNHSINTYTEIVKVQYGNNRFVALHDAIMPVPYNAEGKHVTSVNSNIANVSIGSSGTITFPDSNLVLPVGTAITVSGTNSGTGSISGYSNPTTYYVIDATETSLTLSTTRGGSAVTTTAGTATGLTFTIALKFIIYTQVHTSTDGINWWECTGVLLRPMSRHLGYSTQQASWYIGGEYYPDAADCDGQRCEFSVLDYRKPVYTNNTAGAVRYDVEESIGLARFTIGDTTKTGVQVENTTGRFSCTAPGYFYRGQQVVVTGTNTGNGAISGYTTGTSYYVSDAAYDLDDGRMYFTLTDSRANAYANSNTLTTTVGTLTGLTFTNKDVITSVTAHQDRGKSDYAINGIAIMQ